MATVIYVAIVEGDKDHGYSVYFPDLPGCVSAAETMLELPAAARDALTLHLQGMVEDGEFFPTPTNLEDIKSDPDVKEVGRLLIDADIDDAPVRVNISVGAQFLKRVDLAAEARGMSRSGFLVEGARRMMGTEIDNSRYLLVPTSSDLVVVWDRHEEAVVDVLSYEQAGLNNFDWAGAESECSNQKEADQRPSWSLFRKTG